MHKLHFQLTFLSGLQELLCFLQLRSLFSHVLLQLIESYALFMTFQLLRLLLFLALLKL